MADPEKAKLEGPPESPTTARELDFDDEDLSASPKPIKPTTTSDLHPQKLATEQAAPPQPPRPLNPRQQAETTLKEAFPSIDNAVIRAVLTASGGQLEPAFHALLDMSDPDSQAEPAPPLQPPRPTRSPIPRAGRTQLEADELYARQLAEHYNGPANYGEPLKRNIRDEQAPRGARPRNDMGFNTTQVSEDRERSFIDDDLPVIRDNIRKGFIETQSKVNSFINSLKKKIDGDDEEDYQRPPARTATGYNISSTQQQYGGKRSGDTTRRSAERERYDADPQVLGDDFAGLQMRDETVPRRSTRPLANPDLFKPTPASPPSGRRVSFQDGPPEEIDDLYRASPDPTKRPLSSAGRSKWQPLAAVDPHPVEDHDPFSLGDSDEEDAKKRNVRSDDAEKLNKAAEHAIAGETGSAQTKNLQVQGEVAGSGMKDEEAAGMTTKP
ncbi:ubiquitin-binding protein cue5 [Lambiella insularis]|nr:ubiquitin-binding protein cue5 [Lambiella insularis]